MRQLFNHGLTPEELYSNAPFVVTRYAFSKHVGDFPNKEAAYGSILAYGLGVIIYTMIESRRRFVFPSNRNTYLDFKASVEDEFESNRQNGRFQDIDFINSDFTGYDLRAYSNIKGIVKNQKISVGGYLHQRLVEATNEGDKFFTIKDLVFADIVDEVYKKFNWLDKNEFIFIFKFGLKRLVLAIRGGLAVSIISTRFKGKNYGLHIGDISLKEYRQKRIYQRCMDRKHRRLYTWRKREYDGFYYIGLDQKAYNQLMEDNKNARKLLYFRNICCRRIKEEMYYRYPIVYIFRFPRRKKTYWAYMAKDIKITGVEYLGKCEKLAYTPSDKKWKELIKEYEKTSD